jgi:hypothetical protein
MSRVLVLLAAAGLIGASVGCCHTAGVCDCDFGGYPCYGCAHPHEGIAIFSPAPPPNRESLSMPTPVNGATK